MENVVGFLHKKCIFLTCIFLAPETEYLYDIEQKMEHGNFNQNAWENDDMFIGMSDKSKMILHYLENFRNFQFNSMDANRT